MNRIDELIKKLCPNGVEYRPIWSLTAWDKKFNGVDKEKQKKVISYKYYLSTDFAKVEKKNGNIKYISTGISGDDRYTTEELAGDYIADGEVVCIPWGGTPNVKYHKGKFVTGDNRIATSLDVNILSNKFFAEIIVQRFVGSLIILLSITVFLVRNSQAIADFSA